MKPEIIHWGGGLHYDTGRRSVWYATGFPCCCSGEQARKIADSGTQSWTRERVTCKRCLAQIAKAERLGGQVGGEVKIYAFGQ